jgi:hypothetical protein
MVFPKNIPASPNVPEEIVYYIYWYGLRAGKATLLTKDTSEGVVLTSHATSAAFISLFYKVDDVVQSTLYLDGYPKSYTLKLREGRHRRNKATHFGIKPDNGLQKVVYYNVLDNERKDFFLEKQAFDPLSGFHEIRKRPLEVGRSEFLDVFDNKKLWNVEVKVLRKEHLKIPSGEFDTIVIKPLLKSEGIFLKKGELYIWLTDDEKKIPVMVKSKVKIGNFTAKLVQGEY